MEKLLFRKEDYVSYNPNTNKSTCLLCEQQFAGCIVGNIKRHYESLHHISFHKRRRTTVAHHQAAKHQKKETQENLDTTTQESQDSVNRRELKLRKEEFLKCCVGLVTIKNISPLLFDDEKYFKALIADYEEEYKLDLNSSNIMENIERWALKISCNLKYRLRQRRINLKLDLIKREQKYLMLINASVIENYKLLNFTLGVVAIENWYNDQMLKDEILHCLNEYDINWRQLHAITGDSCGHLNLVMEALQQEIEESSDEDESGIQLPKPYAMNSGYRWIQMAMQEYFASVENSLSDCRRVLEDQRMKYDSEIYNTFTPTLDNARQWESTLRMVCSLKDLMVNYQDLDIKIEWMFIEKFTKALVPVLELTQQLQDEQYLVGDFYRDWLLCELKLKKMLQNEHATKIANIMSELKDTMYNNTAFNAALYFDPRFNFLDTPYLNEERRKQAVQIILKLIPKTETTTSISNEIHCNDRETSSDDPYNILELELHSLLSQNSSANTEDNLSLRQKLEKIALNPRQPYGSDVLNYWRCKRLMDKNLLNGINVSLAVPIGQASTEKAHNIIEKSSVNDNSLKEILLIGLNESVLEIVT